MHRSRTLQPAWTVDQRRESRREGSRGWRTDEDGIIIEWRSLSRRDIEFLREFLRRYFFSSSRSNLSFTRVLARQKNEKRKILRSDETHLPGENDYASTPLFFPFFLPSVLFFCKARLSEEPREVILYTSSFSTRRRSRFLPWLALTYLSGSSFPPL